MSLHAVRDTCHACTETLPRAAAFRCPFCRAPILRATGAVNTFCRLCNKSVPHLHAGKCPSCVSVEQRFGATDVKRKSIR